MPCIFGAQGIPMVLVWMVVFGAMAKSGGRHLVGRQYVGRHLSAWLVPPDSLDHHRPKLWEMAVEKVRWSR